MLGISTMKKTLYRWVKEIVFAAFSLTKRGFREAPYAVLIAGFAFLTPLLPVHSDGVPEVFITSGESYAILNGGTAIMARSNTLASHSQERPIRIYERTITAYSSTPEETDNLPFITASGSYVRFGIVAANWLPIGTAIRIREYFGDQVFIVEDRMNSRNPKKVDVWFPTKEEAINFGKRITKIEVL